MEYLTLVSKSFNPALYQCKTCKTFLQSKYEGQFVACRCGNAVDQTAYYTRIIGNINNLEVVKDDRTTKP